MGKVYGGAGFLAASYVHTYMGRGSVLRARNNEEVFSMKRWTKRTSISSKAMAIALCAAMLAGGIQDGNLAYAAELDGVTSGLENEGAADDADPARTNAADADNTNADAASADAVNADVDSFAMQTVSQSDADVLAAIFAAAREGDYTSFVTDELVANLNFGTDITASAYDGTKGFYDLTWSEAQGWVDGVYYPRERTKTPGTSYVQAGNGCLAITSRVWTETESTGQGTYTYEETSSFDMAVANADYQVQVTLTNPTDTAYTAYLEAEDVTKLFDKASGFEVAPGATVTKEFTTVVVDGELSLKFLAETQTGGAQTVYVSNVKITRLATNAVGQKPTVYLASDSTVQTYEDYYDPQTGWGETLALFFGGEVQERPATDCGYSQARVYEADNVIVENRAIGGRSSKSFVEEGKLEDLLEDIRPGDYLFVQWGHNDATKARPNRYVSPADFGQWIQYYIDGARQRGAIPVLVTPVARYSYSDKDQSFVGNFEEYGNVMRTMGPQQGVPVIDLTARSVALCNSFGKDGAKSLFLMVEAGEYAGAWAGGANDSTHLQWYGAYKFAQCVAQGIQDNSELSDLASKVVMKIPDNVPGKVTGFKSVTVGASSVTLGWDAVEGAELYYIYRKALAAGETADNVDFSTAEKYSVSSKAGYTDSGCESGVTYVYAVRGFNEKGLGEFSDKVTVKTKAAGYKFDFNYGNSPTLAGWTGVGEKQAYDDTKGYGFTVAPGNGRDRGEVAEVPDSTGILGEMGRDFVLGNSVFEVKVPNGDYEVTLYAADLIKGGSTIKSNFTAEGASIGTVSAKQSIGSLTATVRVTDGKLTIGNDGYMTGLTVTQVLAAPTGLTAFEPVVQGSNYTFQLNFTGVDEATSYNVYRKGTTDKDFALVKSFTVQQDKDDQLGCRAQSVRLGDTYQYYMTCITPIGESAPSEICTIKAVLEGVPAPGAPQNVRCTDPAEGVTDLQRSVTIEWDSVGPVTGTNDGKTYNVILYNVYRSDKAEGEKGFKEFVKVGTSETTSFTDDTVATNIPYYYKVTAVNAGGEGEKSEVCKTPVTGSFVTGGRENYSDRALVAINLSGGKGAQTLVSATGPDGQELTSGVYLSWRAFESDMNGKDLNTTFDVYCNGSPIATGVKVTNMVYQGGTANDVFKVVGSNDGAIGVQSVDTKCWSNQYLDLRLFCPANETMPDGTTCDFSANDMSVGDLDGDGVLELIVKWYPSNAQDNSRGGYTGNTYLDGYDINWATGEVSLLWRINLGVNIRSGAHYTQFQVWDYDGDGKAEIAVKTGDGTTSYKSTDGTAAGLVRADSDKYEGYVGAADDTVLTISVNHGTQNCDYRATSGYIPIAEGHEFFSIFNGEDGTKAADDVPYEPFGGNATAWGDSSDGYRNRIDRFLSATAYLDGETPFAVFCRGYYTRTCLTAYYMKDTDNDGVGDTIDIYWKFDTKEAGSQYEAQGNHGLSVNDVDNDGMDEILYGSLAIDHDGSVKWCTFQQHGDAMHVSDWIPWNPGLEVMQVHEDMKEWDVEIHDAETGEVLMGYQTGRDTGRGVAADIDPTSVGAEWWSIAGPNWKPEGGEDEPSWDSTRGVVFSASSKGKDNLIALSTSTPASNFSIFWDGDLLSEVLDHKFDSGPYMPVGVVISKWDYENSKQETMLYSEEIWSNNGTKGNVGLAADILGDWREEIITRTSGDSNVVRVYTTTIQTDYVVPCLLENLAYREGVAWQNVGYNQPANLSYLLSEGLVTAQLSEGVVNAEDAEINFTKANDGVYGHEITGYEIYRKTGDGSYEKIATLGLDDLVESTGGTGGSGGNTNPEEPEIIGWEDGNVVGRYDFGNRAANNADSFTVIANQEYSSSTGYGFVAVDGINAGTGVNQALDLTDGVDADLFTVCGDMAWRLGELTFKVDLPAGTYRVDVYSGAAKNNNAYNNNHVWVNGEDLGQVTKTNTVPGLHKTVEVTLTEAGQVEISAKNDETSRAMLNALVITERVPIYSESEKPGDGTVEIKKEVIFEEDFEGTSHSFKLVADGNSTWEYWEKDTSTVNTNASGHVYGVGARPGGDTGTQLATALGISENVTVAFDLKMDACGGNGTDASGYKSSNFALLGGTNKSNWLDSAQQILTITATGPDKTTNGYWTSIKVNGVDITDKANVNNGTNNGESSGKGTSVLKRDTTGWLRVTAELDFASQEIDLVITRISDNSKVYEGQVGFVHDVTSLENIFMAGAKAYGGVFTDNIEIYTEKEVQVPPTGGGNEPGVTTYVYKDTGLAPVTAYSYKVAAIVDGKTSFMSRPLDIETADKLSEVPAMDPVTLYVGTPIEKGETVASLLPQTIEVTTEAGEKKDYQITWNTGTLDIMKEGEYDVTGRIKGWPDPIPLHVTVAPNAVKGYVPFEDMRSVIGFPAELPTEVVIEWLNTTTTKKKVTWDTSTLDINTLGTYTVEGTVEGTSDKVTIKVLVTENYIASVPTASGEVIYLSDNVSAQLPTTILANYAQGDPKEVAVKWNEDSVSAIDTSAIGTYTITGTVEGFDEEVTAEIKVTYRSVYKFDFGINKKDETEGWTGFTVNVKAGKKTAAELGIDYNAEKGYGFLDGTAVVEGRWEEYTMAGILPKTVYNDFMIPDGHIFAVDLPNGKYEVEVVSGSSSKSDVKSVVEGVTANVSNTAKTYATKTVQVELKDGQMTFEFPNTTVHYCRLPAIIIRLIEADKTALKAAIDSADVLADSELLYTEDSWAAFQTALNNAKAVYDNVYPSGEEVEAATKALTEAQAALKVDPNAADKLSKDALKKAIAAAKALEPDKALYTEESWALLVEKLEAAQAVLDKADATNQERDEARAALQAAQAALEKKATGGVVTGVVKPDDIRLNTGMSIEEILAKLPATIDVTYADGTTGKAAATWDVSKVQPDQAGVYDIILTVDGWSEPIVCKLILTKKVTMDVEASANVPSIHVPELTDEQIRAILSEEDLQKLIAGADIRLALAASSVEDAAISSSVLTLLNEKLSQNGLTVVTKLDIELLKYINDEAPEPITEARTEIPMIITIPEEYRTAEAGYEREFYMVRTHVTRDGNGNETVLVDVLKDQDNDSTTITITTDKFSIYALSYKDVLVETDESDDDQGGQSVLGSSSKTGDQMNAWIWIILLAVCVAGVAAVFGVKFYRNKKQK